MPVAVKTHQVPYAIEEKVAAAVCLLDEQGVWEKVDKGDWAHPLVTPAKADGTVRVMMNLSWLNKFVIPACYPLPTLPEVFQKVQDAAFLSTLDLMKAYHHIELHPESRPLALIYLFSSCQSKINNQSMNQYVKMLLGLKDSRADFQHCIQETLEDCLGAIPYIDDVLVYGKTKQEHDHNLIQVLQALHSKNIRLQLSKCFFWQVYVPFLGHVLSGKELKLSPATVAAIADAPITKTAEQLSSFPSLVTFYINLIPDLATKVEPQNVLGRKGATFTWTEECQKVFDGVKKEITADMVLALYDPNAPTFLYTDASGVGISAVLSQEQGGQEVTVAWCQPHTAASQTELQHSGAGGACLCLGGREI